MAGLCARRFGSARGPTLHSRKAKVSFSIKPTVFLEEEKLFRPASGLNPELRTHTGPFIYPKLSKNHLYKNSRRLERHVVLLAPEIHWNTGNIGRTCLATNAFLHLIKPLGFSLNSRELKRAGLDYWEKVQLTVWNDFDGFLGEMKPQHGEVAVFSKRGAKPFWSMVCLRRMFLVFGSETRGLPENILHLYADATYHIPITSEIRSLNLSTAAGIALYESLRLANPFHGWTR